MNWWLPFQSFDKIVLYSTQTIGPEKSCTAAILSLHCASSSATVTGFVYISRGDNPVQRLSYFMDFMDANIVSLKY